MTCQVITRYGHFVPFRSAMSPVRSIFLSIAEEPSLLCFCFPCPCYDAEYLMTVSFVHPDGIDRRNCYLGAGITARLWTYGPLAASLQS